MTTTTKTFGELRWGRLDREGHPMHGKAVWQMQVAPHVAIKVKRMFPRAVQFRTSAITLHDTAEVARDLEWMLDRYPLIISPEAQARLTKGADEHRATEQAVEDILTHGHRLSGLQEPARPSRDYQTQGADLAWTTHGILIADDLGLGKTQTGSLLFRDPNTLPALVVCPTHLPVQWGRELGEIFPMLATHIIKGTKPYPIDADVIITSYSKLTGWGDHLAGQVKSVIFDEVQELRKGESNKYRAAQRIADRADWKIGLSATPVYNYGGETHTIYEVLAPGKLGTRAEFIREWDGRERSGTENVIVKSIGPLGEYLRDQGMLLRRTRKDVHREIPDPIRITEEVPANPEALDAVQADTAALARMILDEDTNKTDRWRAAGEIDWKMRQATGIAKAPAVAQFVKMLLETERAVVLAGWHRTVYDIWNDMLAEYNPVMYTGTETPAKKQRMVDQFVAGDSRVLNLSLRSGSGLDGLQKASSTVVFGELDWSPQMHNQVIGRLARDGQEETVVAYFLTTDSGSDPAIAEVLELKRQQSDQLLNPDEALFTPTLGTAGGDRVKALARAAIARAEGCK